MAKAIPSLKKVVIVSYTGKKPDIKNIPHAVHYEDFLAKEKEPALEFEQLPFDHPVFIMFSSGTTGKPKCMVQGAGGILINHLKELILHTDLKAGGQDLLHHHLQLDDVELAHSSLGVGATIVLYDGNPNYPDAEAMWKLAQDEKITIFGLSASYINYLRSEGIQPGKNYDLSSLREISQTGSPLSAEGFRVYLPGDQGGSPFQFHRRGHGYQRLFCHRKPHQARLCRGAAEPGPGHEDQSL